MASKSSESSRQVAEQRITGSHFDLRFGSIGRVRSSTMQRWIISIDRKVCEFSVKRLLVISSLTQTDRSEKVIGLEAGIWKEEQMTCA